jgi:hypothetical protein
MRLVVLVLGLAAASPAAAAEYLQRVDSPVITATGSQAELAKRARLCLAQKANAGGSSAAAVTFDPDAGVVVSPAVFGYSSLGIPWAVRSTLTIETKDGRFRMSHTNLQQRQGRPAIQDVLDTANGRGPRAEGEWMGVGMWWGASHAKVEAAAAELSKAVANCISAAPADW